MTAAAIVGEPPLALSDVAAEYRQWHCWAGIPSTGLLYARLLQSSRRSSSVPGHRTGCGTRSAGRSRNCPNSEPSPVGTPGT
jgi:hypothetical protein